MTAWQDDMVIAYRTGEEIIGLTLVGELYHLLGTTEIGLGLTPHQRSFSNKAAREIA